MNKMQTLSMELREKKLKVTPQRLAIYHMLKNTRNHPSAETIHKTLETEYPTMSFATVYKTLSAFKVSGLVQELTAAEGGLHYDAKVDPHPHLICQSCNRIYDFDAEGPLDELRSEIEKDTDFAITSEQIYFFGVCRECKEEI